MKDYLNSIDRDEYICTLHMLKNADNMAKKTNTYTKEEITNLKKASTWANKALDSVLDRMNPSARKTLANMMRDTKAFLDYGTLTNIYAKRKMTSIDAAYEENAEYYRLIEYIFHHNCRNCTKNHNLCLFYGEFEEQFVPNYSGTEQCGECRYSFKGE